MPIMLLLQQRKDFNMGWIFLLAFIGGMIHGFIRNINYYSGLAIELERKEAAQRQREQERLEKLERKRQADINEYLRQLKSIQYQLSLLNKLDDFRSSDLIDEKAVKKALALEKQYHVLCQKERKLKRDLEKLGVKS